MSGLELRVWPGNWIAENEGEVNELEELLFWGARDTWCGC